MARSVELLGFGWAFGTQDNGTFPASAGVVTFDGMLYWISCAATCNETPSFKCNPEWIRCQNKLWMDGMYK